jgi:hypothetical protein
VPISAPTDISNLALWLESKDTATLFQDIAGSSAVTADAQTVGTWNDKSGGSFHLTATADDTTRPTYHITSGVPWVEWDGTNDMLRRTADLGMYAAGAASIFVAVRGNPGTDRRLVASGNSGNNTPVYVPLQSGLVTANRAAAFIRNAAGTELFGSSGAVDLSTTAVFNNTDHVVGVVDTGSSLTLWIDGAEQTPIAYTRSGALTSDRFSLGALLRAAAANFWAGRIYEVAIYTKALDDTEAGDLSTYLAGALVADPAGGARVTGGGLVESRLLRRTALVKASRSMAGWMAKRDLWMPERRLAA